MTRSTRLSDRLGPLALGLLTAATIGACSDDYGTEPERPQATVVTGTGDLGTSIAQFRGALGDPLNNAPGQTAGRREINWDGVPAALTNVDTFPGNFFNATEPAAPNGRKRGAVFSTNGAGFRVSDNDFGDLAAEFDDAFNDFSPAKTFIPVGSNRMDVTFQLPGTATAALVRGFGVVVSDVDRARSTSIQLFDAAGRSLGIYHAPVRSDANGLSFVGAAFASAIVARVRITMGDAAITASAYDVSQGGVLDLVVMDDFLYGEPVVN